MRSVPLLARLIPADRRFEMFEKIRSGGRSFLLPQVRGATSSKIEKWRREKRSRSI